MTDLDTRTLPTLDPGAPMLFGGTGSGKTRPPFLPMLDATLGNAALRSALEQLRGEYNRLAARHAVLLTAAQAAVIESRTSRRDPLTPLAEALAELGETPAPGARLFEVLPATAAAWPTGALG
jgi:hypothetical protein